MSRNPLPLLFVVALLAQACSGGSSATDQDPASVTTQEDGTVEDGATPGDAESEQGRRGQKVTSDEKTGRKAEASNSDGSSTSPGDSASASGGSSGPVASPVPPRTYVYATDGTVTVSGGTREMPSETTLEARGPSGDQQTTLRDLRDDEGNGQLIETRLAYGNDGVRLAYVKVTSSFSGGLTDVREFKLAPPEMIAPAGVKPGYTTSFTMSGSGTQADVTVEALRREKVSVGGSKISALVTRVTIVFSGAVEGHQVSTNWLRPSDLLPMKEKVNSDVRNGPIRFRSNYDATLRAP